MKEVETLSSHVMYENKWMVVREDKIRRSNGSEGIYGVVEKPDFVAIIPIEQNYIHLVEQYRYPVKKRYWEIPQGSWEESPEADNDAVAIGELREETGLISKNIKYVGHIYQAYGYSNQGCHIYLASEFEHSEQELDPEEQGLITKKYNLSEFESMITSGIIKDATTISAYGFAKLTGFI